MQVAFFYAQDEKIDFEWPLDILEQRIIDFTKFVSKTSRRRFMIS
jgi:hypothetical protein